MAATAPSCLRHASAQMIAKPVAMPVTCGTITARPPATTMLTSSGHRRLISTEPGRCSGSIVAFLASARTRAIGGVALARRPSSVPIAAAASHQPAQTITSTSSLDWLAARTVITPSVVAAPALSITVDRRKSTKRKAASGSQCREEGADAGGPADENVGALGQRGRRLFRRDADAEHGLQRTFVALRA